MIEAKRMVQKLISRFRTNDPFRIADSLDYIVIFVPLRGIRGFHQYVQRNHTTTLWMRCSSVGSVPMSSAIFSCTRISTKCS